MPPPPPIYISGVDFGPYMEVPVIDELPFTDQLRHGIPDRINIKTRTYRFDYYEAEHHWQSRELRTEYRARLEQEWINQGKPNPNFHQWVMDHDGYPEMADIIVKIAPAWIYRLIEGE